MLSSTVVRKMPQQPTPTNPTPARTSCTLSRRKENVAHFHPGPPGWTTIALSSSPSSPAMPGIAAPGWLCTRSRWLAAGIAASGSWKATWPLNGDMRTSSSSSRLVLLSNS